jgi:hypothetical protein
MRALASLLLVVLLAGWSFAAAPPAQLTAQQRKQWRQSEGLFRQGKKKETIEAARQGLALERAIFGQPRPRRRKGQLQMVDPVSRQLEADHPPTPGSRPRTRGSSPSVRKRPRQERPHPLAEAPRRSRRSQLGPKYTLVGRW